MPDDDLLEEMGGGGSSSGGSKNKSSSKSSSSSSKSKKPDVSSDASNQEPYQLDDDAELEPKDMEVSQTSMELASETESEYDLRSGEGFEEYVRRQKKECKEFYVDMEEKAEEYSDSTRKFTLVFHAMTWNLAQMRVGVFNVLSRELGLSREEARDVAHQIAREAGENDMMEKIVKLSVEKMID